MNKFTVMIEIKEPYSHFPVAIVENEFFQRDGNYIIELKVNNREVVAITVNKRDLQPYEWKFKEGAYYITLKDWA